MVDLSADGRLGKDLGGLLEEDAALSQDSVRMDALVIPSRTGELVASLSSVSPGMECREPECVRSPDANSVTSATMLASSGSVSPESTTRTFLVI